MIFLILNLYISVNMTYINRKDDEGNSYIYNKLSNNKYELIEERYPNNNLKCILNQNSPFEDKYVRYDINGNKLPFILNKDEKCEYYEDTGNIKTSTILKYNPGPNLYGPFKNTNGKYIEFTTFYNSVKSVECYDPFYYPNKKFQLIKIRKYDEQGNCINKDYW